MADDQGATPHTQTLPQLNKTWRFYAGLTCFTLSFILSAFGVIVPRLGFSKGFTAAIIGVLLVGGPEVMLVFAAVFLGKEGLNYYKEKVWGIFKRSAGPVRYYLCVALMLISSIVPWWLYGYVPQWMPGDSLFRIYFLGGSDLLFVLSFIMAGPEFWEKFIHLLKWEGQTANHERANGRA